jgi:hypothetical protein
MVESGVRATLAVPVSPGVMPWRTVISKIRIWRAKLRKIFVGQTAKRAFTAACVDAMRWRRSKPNLTDGVFLMSRDRTPMWLAIKWVGTFTGIAGAVLIALNIGIVGYGFVLFLISSLLWSAVAIVQRDASLFVLQGTFVLVDVVGVARWLG